MSTEVIYLLCAFTGLDANMGGTNGLVHRDRYKNILFFFFFKQKTAYEIGTGDWSSDVCSSDLEHQFERSHSCNVGEELKRKLDFYELTKNWIIKADRKSVV